MYNQREKEEQRKKRNKETTINHTYIASGKYSSKIRNISDNKKLNRMICRYAREMLTHRSGTELEDMYWIDLDTCKVVAKEIDQKNNSKIIYSKSTKKSISTHNNLLAMHTHPHSTLPSVADFNSAYDNKYSVCLIICHNGKIYSYNCYEKISKIYYHAKLLQFSRKYKNENEAAWETLKDLERNGKIYIKEVGV